MRFKGRAKGRTARRIPGTMNRTEQRYSAHLSLRTMAGEISLSRFEAVTFKLAPDTRYTPDFMVMMPDGAIEFHEVKGAKKQKIGGIQTGKIVPYVEEDAKLKIKIAAEMLQEFRFVMVFEANGNWEAVEF